MTTTFRLSALVFAAFAFTSCSAPTDEHLELMKVDSLEWSPTDSILLGPVGMAAPGGGRLAIADRLGRDVRILDPEGALVRRIGRLGEGPGEFLAPAEVAFLEHPRKILVTDTRTGTLSTFALSGELLDTFRPSRSIGSLTVARNGNLHVAFRTASSRQGQSSNDHITILDESHSLTGSYGRFEGRAHPIATNLHNSLRLAADSSGNVIVFYTYRGLLVRVDESGNVLSTKQIEQRGIPADLPYVELEGGPTGAETISILRPPVGDDIAVLPNGRLIIGVLDSDTGGVPKSVLKVLDPDWQEVGSGRLPYRLRRLDTRGDSIYILRHEQPYGTPAVDIYTLESR